MGDKTGCWNCTYLEYYDDRDTDGYETSDSGWGCNWKDVEHFKTFPCNRKLKCFWDGSLIRGEPRD